MIAIENRCKPDDTAAVRSAWLVPELGQPAVRCSGGAVKRARDGDFAGSLEACPLSHTCE